MKWLIASDIHGSAYYCRELIRVFKEERADRMLLLGDILYHGPRNDLPKEYAPKEVAALLNDIKDRIYAVRGNCEAEVDQLMFQFPVMAEYVLIPCGERMIIAAHGHNFNEDRLPAIRHGDILLNGHTHVPACREHEHYIYMNPGSVSIPKEDSHHGYMMMEDGHFMWKDFAGNVKLERAFCECRPES